MQNHRSLLCCPETESSQHGNFRSDLYQVVVVKMPTTKVITAACQFGTLRAEVESLKSVFILPIKVPTWHFERKILQIGELTTQ